MSRLVTIATFNHSSEYAVLQSHLMSEGIEAYPQNSTTGDILNIYGWEASKIKLQVREDDVPKALEILKSHGFVENMQLGDNSEPFNNPILQNLPIIKNLPPALGFLIVAAVIITVIVIILFFTVLSD